MEDNNYIIYALRDSEFERIAYIPDVDLKEWLETDGIEYNSLRIVKDSGRYADLQLDENNEWDVVNRGLEEVSLHERKATFKDYTRKSTTKLDRKIKQADKDKPLDQRSHMMKAARGLDRKKQSYVPLYKQLANRDTLPTAENVLKNAKSSSSGAWKLSKRQVMEIANKYKFNIPNSKKRTKHLGSTGILMWRKDAKTYYLVKFSKHHHNKGI